MRGLGLGTAPFAFHPQVLSPPLIGRKGDIDALPAALGGEADLLALTIPQYITFLTVETEGETGSHGIKAISTIGLGGGLCLPQGKSSAISPIDITLEVG